MPQQNLVIVESPAKAKTIEKYLGEDFKVLASFGHVRDLPKHQLGVDINHNFEPTYEIPTKAKKVISVLKEAVENASTMYLATDYDREGEAIAWHIVQSLGLDENQKSKIKNQKVIHRITFHEITKSAIEEAIKHPRQLDFNLVDAQQARRVLDRLVGYTLSPFLWKKVMKGLSAGRVQSVAVRLVVDREREIKAFKSEEYWNLIAVLETNGKDVFEAGLVSIDGKKLEKLSIKNESNAIQIKQAFESAKYSIMNIETRDTLKRPSPPFTTSMLQQVASHRLHFSAKATMRLAQDLYEAGYITYMRTDSTNLAEVAVSETRNFIERNFGSNYLPQSIQVYKTKTKGAQEAHEAIRPTDPAKRSTDLTLPSDRHEKLYELIWQRMIACQMAPAKIKQTAINIEAKIVESRPVKVGVFRASGSFIEFPGYLKVWPSESEDKILPELKEGEYLTLNDLKTEQHFTEPPARYSEATLVKALEEQGIGRPSTYAPTMDTIVARGYVNLDNRRFIPTQIGEVVTDLLVEHFPEIVDLSFTAEMEESLDDVAEGKKGWVELIRSFYEPYSQHLTQKQAEVEKKDLTQATDKNCPNCGKPLIIRPGKYGRFYACTGFPECKYTAPFVIDTGITCLECKIATLVERKTKRGKRFWGCKSYPKCKYATWKLDQEVKPPYRIIYRITLKN